MLLLSAFDALEATLAVVLTEFLAMCFTSSLSGFREAGRWRVTVCREAARTRSHINARALKSQHIAETTYWRRKRAGGEGMNVDNLRMAIARAKKTKRELAAVLGLSEHAFFNKSVGASEFKASEIKKLADALYLTPEEIVTVFLR